MSDYYEDYWKGREEKGWFPSAQDNLDPDEEKIFSRFMKDGARVVDYGCGDGERYGRFLKKAGYDYSGFDISTQAVEHAKANGLEVSVLKEDGTTGLPDNSVDFVILFEVLEHLLDPERCLREIHRILKPSGYLAASVPNIAFFANRIEFLLTGFLCPGGSPLTSRKRPWNDPHVRFFCPGMLKRMVREQGFEVAQFRSSDFSLGNLPVVYRTKGLYRCMSIISRPFGWLGVVLPGLFSTRLFVVCAPRKGSEEAESGGHQSPGQPQ